LTEISKLHFIESDDGGDLTYVKPSWIFF